VKRIVILGGGFGGAYCAQALERSLRGQEVEILLIDRHNFFAFYPLLVEAGTGSLEPRHAVVSIRRYLRSSRFRMAEVLNVNTRARTVTTRVEATGETSSISYDHLVLALGSVTRLPPVPGLAEHGFELKGLSDAVALRDRAIALLEAAEAATTERLRRSLLHWVVVGASFTGVELAGEFHVFLRQASRVYPGLRPDQCRITLVELGERILPALDPGLSGYATRQLRKRGIDVRLRASVARIATDSVTLSDGEVLSANTVVWCAGIAPNPLLSRLGLPLDERGYLIAETDLRVRGQDNVWGIGDCAVSPSPDGTPYAATAQNAVRQGEHLARNLAGVLRNRPTRPMRYRPAGTLAALGCRTGVARLFGVKLSGFPAWFVWRSAYLLKMPGWWRRARIALDWTMDLLFPREIVQLGLAARRTVSGAPARASLPPAGSAVAGSAVAGSAVADSAAAGSAAAEPRRVPEATEPQVP